MKPASTLRETNNIFLSEKPTFNSLLSLDTFILIENKMKDAGFNSDGYPVPLDLSDLTFNTEYNPVEASIIEQRIKAIISQAKKKASIIMSLISILPCQAKIPIALVQL